MPQILARRGNITGPDAATENTLPAIEASLARGWGLQLEISRAANGRFHIAPDARASAHGVSADAVCELLRRYPGAAVALRVTALGDEHALATYLREQRVIDRVFLFDMESLERVPGAAAAMFQQIAPELRLAARVSDRREPLERALGNDAASVIWLDEFDRLWATARDVRRLQNQGRKVFAVSPDLHGYPLDVARRRWDDFIRWDVDGITTDYPGALANTLHRLHAVPA